MSDYLLQASRAIRQIAEELLKQDAILTVEQDFAQREKDLGQVAEWSNCDRAIFDAKRNRFNETNAFWLKVRVRGREDMIGTAAARIYRDVYLRELFDGSRLLYDGKHPPGGCRVDLRTREADHVQGILGWIGGCWMHPDYRERLIPPLLLGFAKALLVHDFGIDYALGAVAHEDAETGLGIRRYRLRHQSFGLVWSGLEVTELLWLLHSSRSELLKELELFVPSPIDR